MNNFDKNIHVAMATDDNYAHHLAVVAASILENLSSDRELCLHVLYEELSNSVKEKLEQLKAIRNFDLSFIKNDLSLYNDLSSTWSTHTSKLTYARLKLGSILPSIKKCLYLDCDVVVRRNIAELYDVDVSDYYFGAVEEIEEMRMFRNKDLGIPKNHGYFNAGVLLLNLDAMRENKFYERTLQFLNENKISLPLGDQDALNALFYDKWLALPLKWNIILGMCLMGTATKYLNYSNEEVKVSINNPAIAHYSQKQKPDSFLCIHPFAREYWHYLELTPWKNEVALKDKNFTNHLLRFSWQFRNFIRKVPLFTLIRGVKRKLFGFGG